VDLPAYRLISTVASSSSLPPPGTPAGTVGGRELSSPNTPTDDDNNILANHHDENEEKLFDDEMDSPPITSIPFRNYSNQHDPTTTTNNDNDNKVVDIEMALPSSPMSVPPPRSTASPLHFFPSASSSSSSKNSQNGQQQQQQLLINPFSLTATHSHDNSSYSQMKSELTSNASRKTSLKYSHKSFMESTNIKYCLKTKKTYLNILIVDDSAPNRKMLRRLLENHGHEVTEAEDGDIAIQLVSPPPAPPQQQQHQQVQQQSLPSSSVRTLQLVGSLVQESLNGSSSSSSAQTVIKNIRSNHHRHTTTTATLTAVEITDSELDDLPGSSQLLQQSQQQQQQSDPINPLTTFDIIFMDNFMNRLNGPETTHQLRDIGFENPIIGVTGGTADEMDLFFIQGANMVLQKPINYRMIQQVFSTVIASSST
jgi:CheY-like chemotaxis protein